VTDQSWQTILPAMLSKAGHKPNPVANVEPLDGGVSSDIVLITLESGEQYCAKRALSQLKVEQEWLVPVERNSFEVAWLRKVKMLLPENVPEVICADAQTGTVVLQYLPADQYENWKQQLMRGQTDAMIASSVGTALGTIHTATLHDPAVAVEFASDALFDGLRLDPYLRFTAEKHPDLAPRILAVLDQTATSKIALVHGDISPKNILINRTTQQPVFLDAECAWFGDPVFDAAFCLNHFLLKSIYLPDRQSEFMAMANAFQQRWLACFAADITYELQRRLVRLLPCLMLARIDGKSPVEYLNKQQQNLTRTIAKQMIVEDFSSINSCLDKFISLSSNPGLNHHDR
jgi:5-methylthioribose kinase